MHTVRLQGTPYNHAVGKIVCLGRNYAEHIRELGNTVPDRPVIFIKPASSIIGPGESVEVPPWSQDCHHEVELAILIGRRGKAVTEEEAMDLIAGYGVAIDMTLRDVQQDLKQKGLPWEVAKGFDTACPLSDFVAAEAIDDPHDLKISLAVNGEIRQNGSTAAMLRRLPTIIRDISAVFTLEPGDIILTGTPSGVGPVRPGDRMRAQVEKVGVLEVGVR